VRGDVHVLFGEDVSSVGCDFVVDDGLVVFAYDVYTEFLGGREQLTRWVCPYYTYDDVVRLEFIRFALQTLRTESFAIDKSTIKAPDVLYEYLGRYG
jgi:hypothetical protein